jgi:uroporphyrinogen decarboxylase
METEKLKNKRSKKSLLVDYLATRQVTNSLLEFFSLKNERDLLDYLECDFYYLSCRDISQNESCLPFYQGPTLNITNKERICPLGIKWKRSVLDDKFGVDEAILGPLQKDFITEKDILNLSLPKPEWFDFSPLIRECELFQDKIIIGGLWSGIHGDSYRLMGYENFLLHFAMNKALIKTLVDRVTDFYLEMNYRYFETLKDKMDIFFMGNDFGSQNGLLISKEDWHEIYFENYKKLIDLAHNYHYKVMVHSCGAIEPLIPYFIALGVDIIDPVQITAHGMEPKLLVKKYGKEVCFHGAIDTQWVIPYGSRKEIEEHVIYIVNQLNKFNRYIAAPANNFMTGTPPQNIEIVYTTLKKINNFSK